MVLGVVGSNPILRPEKKKASSSRALFYLNEYSVFCGLIMDIICYDSSIRLIPQFDLDFEASGV